MRKIAITLPEFFEGEAAEIASLLHTGGFWRIHLRKPGATEGQVAELLNDLPKELYPRLTMHYHFDVAKKYSLGGVHLNSYNPTPPHGWTGSVSRSFHSIEEINSCDYDYAFLSPIYPSISKPGYKRNFDLEQLREVVDEKIFSLGGVTPDKFSEIKDLGFGGVAMLGNVWRAVISSERFRLQFITHASDSQSIVAQVEKTLRGGCRWIQLRHKDADTTELIKEGRLIRRLCDEYGATFIIDDQVELVETIGADGVHLGKNDMPVTEARKILGMRKIIGATANTYEDIVASVGTGADYIGLGPYRFTTTKEKLSPVLGLAGYNDIIDHCRTDKINIPIVAIGGIERNDITPILSTGVSGIAVSGAIRNAENPELETAKIIQSITN